MRECAEACLPDVWRASDPAHGKHLAPVLGHSGCKTILLMVDLVRAKGLTMQDRLRGESLRVECMHDVVGSLHESDSGECARKALGHSLAAWRFSGRRELHPGENIVHRGFDLVKLCRLSNKGLWSLILSLGNAPTRISLGC